VNFKRSVYASALGHLAPFARQVAGPTAIPHPSKDLRPDLGAPGRQRPRRRVVAGERGGGSAPEAN
jgi:putative (di)nucleoside polyphosphate hydrolase